MDKDQYRYIWNCICNHEGFAEDRGEWLKNNEISEEEIAEFENLVTDAINFFSMINKRKQGDSCLTQISFDTGLFCIEPDLKHQVIKILEEAAEVYSAWEKYDTYDGVIYYEGDVSEIADECADVIQASLNMMYALGMDKCGIETAMNRCLNRNKQRGRC